MRSTYEQSKLKLDSLKRYVDNLDTLNWVILKYSQGMFDGKPTLDINLTEKKCMITVWRLSNYMVFLRIF